MAKRNADRLVRLSRMPAPAAEHLIDFSDLTGGLNTYELSYRLKRSESPDMQNLLWQDGALCCRDGQSWLLEAPCGTGHACYEGLFHGFAFFHIGEKIWRSDLSAGAGGACELAEVCDLGALYPGYAPAAGVFFRYGDFLFYKARGVYVRIAHNPEGDTAFTAGDMAEADRAYTPVTLVNADAESGAGDLHQPENRLSPRKTVWYNAAATTAYESVKTTAAAAFTLATPKVVDVAAVTLAGKALTEGFDYTVSIAGGKATLTFYVAQTAGQTLAAELKVEGVHYQLPVRDPDTVLLKLEAVMSEGDVAYTQLKGLPPDHAAFPAADPAAWNGAWDAFDWVFWPETGHILLKTAAHVSRPAANNTVRATYSLGNPAAMESVMDCALATVYGADRDACVVLGGCPAQPNAYFWNGSHAAMDAGYFPMEHYNLAGDTQEKITGFGRQYGTLVVLKERSVGKTEMRTTEIDGRARIAMDYTPINAAVGCDLPGSVQIVENNIVFANTQQGVHRVASSSPALENNIRCISRKVNGTPAREGLLDAVRAAGKAVSLDDGRRYWLCAGGAVYVWDYELSGADDPSWFYCTNIRPAGFVRTPDGLYHLDGAGRITRMDRSFSDYGGAIEKRFAFPAQVMGGYDRLKDVTGAIFALRSDTSSRIEITYETDWETRKDRADVLALSWNLAPRNLAFRYLGVARFATVARRKPFCRHVRHLSVRLENGDVGADMTLVSAQIFYKYQGRDR